MAKLYNKFRWMSYFTVSIAQYIPPKSFPTFFESLLQKHQKQECLKEILPCSNTPRKKNIHTSNNPIHLFCLPINHFWNKIQAASAWISNWIKLILKHKWWKTILLANFLYTTCLLKWNTKNRESCSTWASFLKRVRKPLLMEIHNMSSNLIPCSINRDGY